MLPFNLGILIIEGAIQPLDRDKRNAVGVNGADVEVVFADPEGGVSTARRAGQTRGEFPIGDIILY